MPDNEEALILSESLEAVEEVRAELAPEPASAPVSAPPVPRSTSKRYSARVRALSIGGNLFRKKVVKVRLNTTEGSRKVMVPTSQLDGNYAVFRVVSMSENHVVCTVPDGGKSTMACFLRSNVDVREI